MISVIIPVYNCEDYLYVCLNSLLKQSYSDFEVICIDDNSTDSSLEILKYFAKEDHRIKIFENSHNKGVSYSRNKGLKLAKGEYIFFLDSDDWITSNAFQDLFENAENNDSDLVFYKLTRLDNLNFILNRPAFDLTTCFDKNVDFNNFTFTYKNIKEHIMTTSYAVGLKLYKKSFLEKYDDLIFPEGIVYEDIVFHIKTILRASKISFVPKSFYIYRLDNQNSIMHTLSNVFDIFNVIKIVEIFIRNNNFYDEIKLEFYIFKITQILQYLNKTKDLKFFNMAKRQFEESVPYISDDIKDELKKTYPIFWKDYLKVLNSINIDEYLQQ